MNVLVICVEASLIFIMKVKNALILAAGAGTRMGEIGEKLPKVLWPVFEKSILELEVLYAQSLGIENIFINTFNYKEKIKEFYNQSEILQKASLIEENEKLDIGGAVHNLAKKLNYEGELIIFNSDQFIFLTPELWNLALELFAENDHLIFSYDVNTNDLYNALITENNVLKSIVNNKDLSRNQMMQTYTGMSLIKLDRLNQVSGESKFFESVADFDNKNVYVFNIKDSVYWDFGTLKRYHDSIYNIIENIDSDDPFISFLIKNNGIQVKKVNKSHQSYQSDHKRCLIFDTGASGVENSIILKGPHQFNESLEKEKIIYQNIIYRF